MAQRDPKAIYDGFQALNGGMNSGLAPNAIAKNQVAFARNVTFRGGFPKSRPGWNKKTLRFASGTVQTNFEDGLFQGASAYEPPGGGAMLMAAIGGRFFKIDVSDRFKVDDISITPRNSATRPKAWFVQAEEFLVMQDGESAALIYDGSRLRRVDPTSVPEEIPVGTVMEYSGGRIWVVKPDGKSFVAGDLIYGSAGTAPAGYRDSLLKFSENDFLNEGGEFSIPVNAGRIRSMRAIANIDTSLGQGPLQVMAERAVFSVNAPFDRTTWKNLEYPIQTVSLIGSGARSHEGSVLVNGDIWFRATDGIRSFQVARRDHGTWVNTPLSSEMDGVIGYDDINLLEHSSAGLFDNRYLVTASPRRVGDHGIVWRGLIALDFHNVSGIGTRSAPVYDGLWTGLSILQVVLLGDRCFIFALSATNKIQLWELSRANEFDAISTRIPSYIDTASFGFNDSGWNRKELSSGDLWFDDLVGTVDFDVDFWPDQYPDRIDWHSWSVDSKRQTCPDAACEVPGNYKPQYRTRMRLPRPDGGCNTREIMAFNHGFEFQARIAWTGHARLKKFRVVAHEVQEDTTGHCQETESADTAGVVACDSNLFTYSSDA